MKRCHSQYQTRVHGLIRCAHDAGGHVKHGADVGIDDWAVYEWYDEHAHQPSPLRVNGTIPVRAQRAIEA